MQRRSAASSDNRRRRKRGAKQRSRRGGFGQAPPSRASMIADGFGSVLCHCTETSSTPAILLAGTFTRTGEQKLNR